jgi:hypothetical protein
MFSKALLASTLVTAIMAWDHNAALRIRQDDSSISSMLASASSLEASASAQAALCTIPPSVLSILETAPTPPADLESAFTTITDACHLPSFTGTLDSEYKSYTSAVFAWSKSNSDVLNSFESSYTKNCPLATATSLGAAGICATAAGATATGSATGATTGSATGSATGAASTGAAPQHTGLAIAAAAVAGIVGVVAAL